MESSLGDQWRGVRQLVIDTPFDTMGTVLARRAENDAAAAPVLYAIAAWCSVIRDDLDEAATFAELACRAGELGVTPPSLVSAAECLAMVIDASRGRRPFDHDQLDRMFSAVIAEELADSEVDDLGQFAWVTEMANWFTFADRYDDAARLLDRRIPTLGEDGTLNSDAELISALCCRAELDLRRGRWARAERDIESAIALSVASGHTDAYAHAVGARIAAGRGDFGRFDECFAAAWKASILRGDRSTQWRLQSAEAFEAVSAGQFDRACRLLEPLQEHAARSGLHLASARLWEGDLLEALVVCDDRDGARQLMKRIAVELDAVPSRWGRALLERGLGLTHDDPRTAGEHLWSSAARFDEIGAVFEAARSRLLHAELLSRSGESGRAGSLARSSLLTFESVESAPWTNRAAAVAGGRHLGERSDGPERDRSTQPPPTLALLTPQEREVARFTARGLSNKELAAQLFVSVKTVESHLTQIYRKLDLRSRSEFISAYLSGELA